MTLRIPHPAVAEHADSRHLAIVVCYSHVFVPNPRLVAFSETARLIWSDAPSENSALISTVIFSAACGSLARLKAGNTHLAERFELYIHGLEICNAFSELADSHEQRARFEAEKKVRVSAGKDDYPLPENFLKTLDDMPEAAGNALGIDRLVMLFADTNCIDDVVAFTPEEL